MSPRVLVVEDEAMVSLLIEEMLSDVGYRVVGPVANNRDVICLLASESEPIDAAILDINLGDEELSLATVAELVRREIPFAFVTGYSDALLDMKNINAPVLVKPFSEKSLDLMIQQLIQSSWQALE